LLAIWRDWQGRPARCDARIAGSLGLFAGNPAPAWQDGGTLFAHLPAHRFPRPVRGWQPARAPSGAHILFHGVIENAASLAQELGLAPGNPAVLYGAAVDRWGPDADLRVTGRYCSIVAASDSIRLARSPWDSPPLHYASFDGMTVAASVPRVLLAAGLPDRLDQTKLADNLYYNLLDAERGWYEGAFRVPHGCCVTLTERGVRLDRFYDPASLPDVRFANPADYVAAAAELLGEAVSKTLERSRRPAIQLSGGLDSAIIADEVLRQLPPGQTLSSFTFTTLKDWTGAARPGLFNDDRARVQAFAAMHPQLDPWFTENTDTFFDAHWREMFTAMGAAPNYLCNYYPYHEIWRKVREAGCDAVLTGEFGNQTISFDGRSAYVEYLRTGRWRQLRAALAGRSDDPRTMWQRFAALSLVRSLPAGWRRAIRKRRHPGRVTINETVSMLPPASAAAAKARAAQVGAVFQNEYFATRREAIEFEYRWIDCDGGDVAQAFEQLYGLTQIDVLRYRPLVELCAGMPTSVFMKDGIDRWLARELATGRMPEAQRLERRQGDHNPDWMQRMAPRRAELGETIGRIADKEHLRDLLDTERMHALLADWDEGDPADSDFRYPREAGIARGILTARFVEFNRGSNDL
jgi:asparagine synthase (glutamine-hydrolysing)